MSTLSRRSFAVAAAAFAASAGTADEKPKSAVTSASVPGDPSAPAVSEGTQPDKAPFDLVGTFSRNDVPLVLQSFALGEVKLSPGVFLDAQSINLQYLESLPVARLLHNFRINAGLPSKAEPLGGWEKPDCELRGHFVGHYLSACALMYASVGNQTVKQKGDEVVAGLVECQTKLGNGYLSAFPTELFDRLRERQKVWAPFYTIHKILAGLIDMYQLTGNSQALEAAEGIASWTDQWTSAISEDRMQMVLDTEYGGMNDALYILADITGNAHYGKVGDRFTKKRFFNPLANQRDELRGLHVNTHIPQVIGAQRRYQMTADRRFSYVADYFFQEVTNARTYATGGTSNNEGWLTPPFHLAEELSQGSDTTECCCAYNMLKLARMLYQYSGDPRYFDYYERTLLNHRLGTIKNPGEMQYYLSVKPGAWKTFSTPLDSFWCCDGTGVEEYSKLADSIYFHDANGLYVNLFIASQLNSPKNKLGLRQETSFPEKNTSRLVLEMNGPLTIHLRMPQWLASPARVTINGKELDATSNPGSYLSVRRNWNHGDIIELELPMALRYESMPDQRSLRAVMFGPLVLAGELGDDGISSEMVIGPGGPQLEKVTTSVPSLNAEDRLPADWLKDHGNLTFTTIGEKREISFKPFYKVFNTRYSIYWQMGRQA